MSTRIAAWLTRKAAVSAAVATLLVGTAVGAQASTANGVPIGNVDKVSAVSGGLRVEGWAWDPSTTAAVSIVVTAGSATTVTSATNYRPDVARVFAAAGSYRGFDITVPASGGDQLVCVVATNVGAGWDKKFPCTTVTVTGQAPVGSLDVVTQEGAGIRVEGWAADRDTTDPIDVQVAVDGITTTTVLAANARADVHRVFPDLSDHTGFAAVLDVAAGTHQVCATAVGVAGGGNKTFPCRSVTVIDHDPSGALTSAIDTTRGSVHVAGWAGDSDATGPVLVVLTVAGTHTTVEASAADPHAFSAALPVSPGTYDVCARAENVGPGVDVQLGCLAVTVVNHDPAGALVSVIDSNDGGLRVTGWASDADATGSLDVRLVLDGTAVSAVADASAPFAFTADLPVDVGTHQVCATAVNEGPGTDVALGCLTATVVDHNPQGNLDTVVDSADGSLVASGWASDADASTPLDIRVTVDGQARLTTTGSALAGATTTVASTEPAAAFSVEIPATLGTHQVCATAVNVGPGNDTDLGCLVAILTDHRVVGSLDAATDVGGAVRIAGWAADRDSSDPLVVRIVVDDVVTAVTTGDARPDVARVFPELGATTGFDATIDVGPGQHVVCATGVNVGPGVDRTFPCKTVTIAAPIPDPAPVPDPSPSPDPTPTPGPETTGVPAGTQLTVHEGDLTVTVPGTVIDSLDIHGYLRIKAANVTVKNTVVRGRSGLTGEMALVQSSSPGVQIIDSEFAATYPTWGIDGFVGNNVTFTRVDVHHVVDCIKLTGGNVVVQDSWLHDNLYFATTPAGHDTHSDSIQVQAGTGITVTNTVLTGSTNSGVMITQDSGAVADFTFTGNQADDGKCTMNIAEKSYGPVKGLRVVDNTFGNGQEINHCAVITPLTTSTIATISGNTFADGTAFKVNRG